MPSLNSPLFANLIETTDAPDTTATGYSMGIGDTFSGTLNFNSDEDWVAVTLVAGQTYTVSLGGAHSGTGTLFRPYLRLMDGVGTEVASDDTMWGNAADNFRRYYT